MKLSLNWLREFVDIEINPKKIFLDRVIIGYVEKLEKHPNADRLNVAQVNIGAETVQIVCGGTNLKADEYVPVALPGAILPGNFEIKQSEIRGVLSNGMICNQIELDIGKCDPKEIMLLNKKEAEKDGVGTPFAEHLKLKGYSPQEIGNLLTLRTAEVEEVVQLDKNLQNIVTGKLLSYKKTAKSEMHHEATVDIGNKKITLIFGSVFKLEEGWILPVALPGAIINGTEVKEVEMHGAKSQGIICHDKELGIENSESGMTILAEDTPLGIPLAEALKLNDYQLEIDNKSLTHRPDLWGHYGMAREVAAITGGKLKEYKPKVKFPSSGEKLTVDIKDPKLSARFAGCLMSGIKIKESPQWIKGRLQAAGVRPVNNIVDVTNYVMLEYGQPMHAYDRDIVKTDKLIVQSAKDGEVVETIDHKKRKLTKEDIIVTNGKEFLGVAGIMGGLDSEINNDTTNVILEAANWPASVTRRSSQRLGLRSDASQRFEKSQDPNACPVAVQKAAEIILEICPGSKIVSPLVDVKNHKDTKPSTTLSVSKAQSQIGKEIPAKEMQEILESLEFKVAKKDNDTLKVEIPSWRATKDVSIEADLIEEISRMHGYENIEEILPDLPIRVPQANTERLFKHRLRRILSYQLGFDEVMNYSFYGRDEMTKSLIPDKNHIKLDNFLSAEQTHMRVSLIPNLLKSIELNTRQFKEFKVYELGHTYIDTGDYFPNEEKQIAGAVVLNGSNDEEAFTQVKGAIETMLDILGYKYDFVKDQKPAPYSHPNKSALIMVDGVEIGGMAVLHPLVQKNWDLNEHQVAMFEINLTKLFTVNKPQKRFNPINKFPSIEIDISVLVKKDKPVGDMQKLILETDEALIKKVDLFDLYEGENIEEGRKALAFRITLQSDNKTLTDEEMNKVQEKIFKRLMSNGGKIRGL